MLPKRPLLYLSLPSLALLIGLVWFRRKKALLDSDRGRERKSLSSSSATTTATATMATSESVPVAAGRASTSSIATPTGSVRHSSDSMPIGVTVPATAVANTDTMDSNGHSVGTCTGSNNSSNSNISCRSAPIPINSRGRRELEKEQNGHNSSSAEDDFDSDLESPKLSSTPPRRDFHYLRNYQNAATSPKPSLLMDMGSPRMIMSPFKKMAVTSEPEPQQLQQNDKVMVRGNGCAEKVKIEDRSKEQSDVKVNNNDKEVNIINQNNHNINNNNHKNSGITNARDCDKQQKANVTSDNITIDDSPQSSSSSSSSYVGGGDRDDDDDNTTNSKKNGELASINAGDDRQHQTMVPPTMSSPVSRCSRRSKDSGTGTGTSPPSDVAPGGVASSTYEFLIHKQYAGVIIGSKGVNVRRLNKNFNVEVVVRSCPGLPKPTDQLCVIEGAATDIQDALRNIRERLPIKKYPDLTMERVSYLEASRAVGALPARNGVAKTQNQHSNGLPEYRERMRAFHESPATGQLPASVDLIVGINNEVMMSALKDGHSFVQHPSHPTFQGLYGLRQRMTECYKKNESPAIVDPQESSLCVAPWQDCWYRVVIMSRSVEQGTCLVKFMDYGGYLTVKSTDLRQIHIDFLKLPFQSTECILSNLRPIGGVWSVESQEMLLTLTKGLRLQAQVTGYTAEGNLPMVWLYASFGPGNVVFINREMVAQGFAEWVEDEDDDDDDDYEVVEEKVSAVV